MDATNKAKLNRELLPGKAGWILSNGTYWTGTIIARGPDYFEVRTDSGDTYRQAVADLLSIVIPLNQPS